MALCNFGVAWLGDCPAQVAEEGQRCEKHANLKCASCNAPATHTCDETGQLVCGTPLCDNCEHAIAPDGTNGGVGFYTTVPKEMQKDWKTHIKKTEQKYEPWYARKENK